MVITSAQNKYYKLVLDHPETNPYERPIDQDELFKYALHHGRYSFRNDFPQINTGDYNNWEEYLNAIQEDLEQEILSFPIYMYEHSGISFSTTPFGYIWDSGKLGYAIITKEKLFKEYNVEKITESLKKNLMGFLQNILKEHTQYINGEIYTVELYKLGDEVKDNEFVDSVGWLYTIENIEEAVHELIEDPLLISQFIKTVKDEI